MSSLASRVAYAREARRACGSCRGYCCTHRYAFRFLASWDRSGASAALKLHDVAVLTSCNKRQHVVRGTRRTSNGQSLYICCFAVTGGLEGYLLTMAFRYIGDAVDVPGTRRQSSSRLLSLLGVVAVNPISLLLGYMLQSGQIQCTDP